MPRIRFTVRPINAPQASRKGGGRSLRHNAEGRASSCSGRDLGSPCRGFAPLRGWWILPAAAMGLIFWAVLALAISTRIF